VIIGPADGLDGHDLIAFGNLVRGVLHFLFAFPWAFHFLLRYNRSAATLLSF
jgi:hypothetical protein